MVARICSTSNEMFHMLFCGADGDGRFGFGSLGFGLNRM